MVKTSRLIEEIEEFAPLSLATSWDNTGWQIYLGDKDINKVIIALTPTINVIKQAIEEQADLLITHHPVIFNKINKLTIDNTENAAVMMAIKGSLAIYSAHTNLDATQNGIADKLASLLELTGLTPIETIDKNLGIGRIGRLKAAVNLDLLITKLKTILNTNSLNVINPSNKKLINTIALCPGGGGDFIDTPKLEGVDLYISGDIKYHTALKVKNIAVIDAGHFETEQIILPDLKKLIESTGITTIIADEEHPWQTI